MTTCTITFSAVDTALQVKPNSTLIFEPSPRVIRGVGATVMTPDTRRIVSDASGAGSIALVPGNYRLSMDTSGGSRQVDITVPATPTALLGDLIDTPLGEYEFSALQQLRADVTAAAGQVALDRGVVASDRVLSEAARVAAVAAAPVATDAAAQSLVYRDQAALYAGSFGPGMILHRPDEAIPTGWWDTGLRQSATSELWGNTATLALISNWSTASLYTGGIATAFFDFSTTSREFQDVFGTGLTAAGQSVAMVRDAISPQTFGPELVANGGFNDSTEWTFGTGWSIAGGVATKAVGSGTNIRQTNTVSITAGRVYRVRADVTATAGTLTPAFFNAASQVITQGTAISASGSNTQFLVAPANAARIGFVNNTAFAGTVDNVSLQEVLGMVAIQPSASVRGRWGSWPVTGRRNLVAFSEPTLAELGVNVGVATAASPIAGFAASIQFSDNSSSRWAYLSAQAAGYAVGVTATVSFFVQMDDGGVPVVGTSTGGNAGQDFTIIVGGGAASNPQVTPVSGSVYRVSGSRVLTGSGLSSNGPAKYAAQSPRGFRVSGYQVEIAAAASAYQRVSSNGDAVTEGSLRNSGMWRPDLVDDSLTFNLPVAVDGELILLGRDGSWRETRLAAAGAQAVIGGTGAGTLATPGILRATGPLVAMGFRQGVMTADEWLRLKRRWRAEGARGELIAGANMILNGTFDADVSGWTQPLPARGTLSWSAGTMRIEEAAAGSNNFVEQVITTVAGVAYLFRAQAVEAVNAAPRIYAGVVLGSSALGSSFLSASATGQLSLVFLATSTETRLNLNSMNSSAAGAFVRFDKVTVQPLTPEW